MEALVDEAHRKKRYVAAHACYKEGTLCAVKAGMDTIDHGLELSGEIITLMVEKGIYLVPTFTAPWAISAATSEAASCLRMEGKLADLLVVKGDPLADISLFQKKDEIGLVMKEGTVYANRL